MKKAMIVYDSVFGNTERVAQALKKALEGSSVSVEIYRAGNAPRQIPEGIELLIAGSPTRAFRPTGELAAYVKNLPAGSLSGCGAAAFDTRISLSSIPNRVFRWCIGHFGYAAPAIAEQMKKAGGELLLSPEGFAVLGKEGPLAEGEEERAAQWISSL